MIQKVIIKVIAGIVIFVYGLFKVLVFLFIPREKDYFACRFTDKCKTCADREICEELHIIDDNSTSTPFEP